MGAPGIVMTSAQHFLPLVIGLPLLAAVFCLLVSNSRWSARFSILFASIHTLVVMQVLSSLRDSGSVWRYELGGWGAPLGIDLVLDGFSVILLFATTIVVLCVTTYSAAYFKTPQQTSRFWPLWWLLVAGLNAAFLSGDAFNLYVALEIIGLSSVALVALAGNVSAITAALRYALVGLLGSLCYLMGVALLYRAYGTLDLALLSQTVQGTPITWAALALISVGLLLKTALLPLHFWLPPAHAGAPAPVSAALSALVVKASFYVLARFWLDVCSPAASADALNLLGFFGACAIFWGCFAACRAKRLKLLVAYSTVAQLGYLFLLFPLTAAYGPSAGSAALAAVAYLIVAHAFAKAAMFMAAGSIQLACGYDDIDRLRGVVSHQPISVFTFAIAGASLIGLPPTGGFIAKWLLLNSAIDSGQWWWIAVILCGGLFSAIYIFRVLILAFTARQGEQSSSGGPTHPIPQTMMACGFMLAIATVALGFNAEWLLSYMDINLIGFLAGTEPLP